MQRAHRSLRPARLIGIGLLVVLVVAMVLNTKFLNPEELAAAGPVKFDPKATADELFTKAKAELPDKASEVGEVVPAMQADTKTRREVQGRLPRERLRLPGQDNGHRHRRNGREPAAESSRGTRGDAGHRSAHHGDQRHGHP